MKEFQHALAEVGGQLSWQPAPRFLPRSHSLTLFASTPSYCRTSPRCRTQSKRTVLSFGGFEGIVFLSAFLSLSLASFCGFRSRLPLRVLSNSISHLSAAMQKRRFRGAEVSESKNSCFSKSELKNVLGVLRGVAVSFGLVQY